MQWITDHTTLVLAIVALASELLALIPESVVKSNSVAQLAVNAAKGLLKFLADFVGKKPAGAALVLVLLSLSGCASINKFVCGTTGHLVPPDAQACTVAALAAATEIAVNVPACKANPTGSDCINAVIAAGKDLSPCLPVCVSDAKQARSVAIQRNALYSNVCHSLAVTGHSGACR